MAEAGPPPSGNWWDDLQSSVTSFKLPDLPDIEMPSLTPPGTGNPFALWGNDAAVPAADGQEAAPTVLPTAPVQDPVAPVQVSRDVDVDLGAVGSRDVVFDLGGVGASGTGGYEASPGPYLGAEPSSTGAREPPRYEPSQRACEWPDRDEVERWTPTQVAEWVTLMGFGKFAHSFVTHKITGKLLVQLEDMHLGNMGIGIIGVRMNMCDAISQLKRVYNKPETASLKVPSYPARFLSMLTFAWANTSEGKSADSGKEEVMVAMGMISMVATLVWGIGWSVFFAAHKDCYCDMKNPTFCYCSVPFDLQQSQASAVFYATSGVATFSFMMATIFSVLQMIMMNECSDSAELEGFSGTGQMPSVFLVIGIGSLLIPINIYLVVTRQFGTYWVLADKVDLRIQIFSIVLLALTCLLVCHGFVLVIPKWIAHVYNAKITQVRLSSRRGFVPCLLWLSCLPLALLMSDAQLGARVKPGCCSGRQRRIA